MNKKYNIKFDRKIRQVELQDDRITVLLPMRPIGDIDFLVTVLYDALMLGISWKEIKELEKAPKSLGQVKVLKHIKQYGRKIYAPSDTYLGANGYEYIRIS